MAALVPVPAALVTLMFDVLAPFGTVTRIWVSESKIKLADFGPNATRVAPVNPVPVIVTTVLAGPLAGANDVITGATMTTKSAVLMAVPAAFVTVIFPVVAP